MDDSYFDDNPVNNGPNLKRILYIAAGIILLLIIIGVIVSFNKKSHDSYSYYESELVKSAKKYIQNNSIVNNQEIYLDVKMLGVDIPNNCSITSGVIYQDGNYKPYLSCSDYESKVLNNNSSVVKLNGKEIMVIARGMTYSEVGYSSNDQVKVSGLVGNEPGVYNIYYMPVSSNNVIIRKVIVVDNPEIVNLYPMLRLNGQEIETLSLGSQYVDSGAIAYDNKDGEITNKIVRSNLPNTNVAGEYTVSYTITNSLGYSSSIKRQVVVMKNTADLVVLSGLDNEKLTNGNVNIIINIVGDNYSYTVLPDGSTTSALSFKYQVSENDAYLFEAHDNNNNLVLHEVNVENIYRDNPEATCQATLYNTKMEVNVNVLSDIGISGYRYNIAGATTGYLMSNTYTSNSVVTQNISVDLRDVVGNQSNISCSIIDRRVIDIPVTPVNPGGSTGTPTDPSIGNNNIKYFTYHDVEYVVANTYNDAQTLVRLTRNTISQSADETNCGDQCLSFAKYYATFLRKGNLSSMNLIDACNYNNLAKFKSLAHSTKSEALNTVYNEINSGRVVVLQVTGATRTRRHFYTIVGYRRDKYNAASLTEEDLLGIDAWTGNFAFLSSTDSKKRTMFDNKDKYGYRVDVFE